MQNKIYTWHLTLFLLFGSFQRIYAEDKQPVQLQALVNKAIATTTETVTFTVILKTEDLHKDLRIPEFGDTIHGFRIENFGESPPTLTDDDQWKSSRWYNLRADISGSYILPGITITFDREGAKQSVKTSEIFIEVGVPQPNQADPEGEAMTDIRDLKNIQAFPPNHTWILLIAVGAGLLLSAYAIFWWIKRRLSRPHPSVPPEVQALARLDRLQNSSWLEDEKFKPFHFSLSAIIRDFIEGRFNFPASDKTLDEIQREMDNLPISPNQRTQLLKILQMTDTVKFTDLIPDHKKSQALLSHAVDFVNQTSPSQEQQDSVI